MGAGPRAILANPWVTVRFFSDAVPHGSGYAS